MSHVKVARRSLSLDQWSRILFERVGDLVVVDREPTSGWEVRVGSYSPEGTTWDGPPEPIGHGELWGRPDGAAEFVGQAIIPERLSGRELHFAMRTAAEVILSVDGRMTDGLDPNRHRAPIGNAFVAGQLVNFTMEAYSRSKPDDERNVLTRAIRGCVQEFDLPFIEVIDPHAFRVFRQLMVLHAAAFGEGFSEDVTGWLQARVAETVRLMPELDAEADRIRAALGRVGAFLDESVFGGRHGFGKQGRLACVAHSHLDIAYHWRVAQTVQKNARTCLIQLRLMERHPEFRYAHSQSWAYEMLEKHQPELFEEVRRRISEGRWEIVGGLYVEPDCNLPSAESHIRQILYGKRYFLEKFAVEIDNCWLPDVFGNSPILPQILKLGGIRHFVSNKMSTWNDTNRFPHNHFRWRGLDGSEVCACVPPTHFITWHDPNQWTEHWRAFIDKALSPESLQMFGFGDGGSGVTGEMVEDFQWVNRLPETPVARLCSASDFLREAFAEPEKLPVWDGELYLEMHRGTFTTKGWLKRENRRAEFLAYEAELLCALAALRGADYPADQLRTAWKRVLLNQFHDILPGSHTHPVYGDAMGEYEAAAREFEEAANAAWLKLAVERDSVFSVFNPFSFARDAVAEVPEGIEALRAADGSVRAVQRQIIPGSGGVRPVIEVGPVGPLDAVVFERCQPAGDRAVELVADRRHLENAWFRIEFDGAGRMTRLFDKVTGRETLAAGSVGNVWQMFDDRPGNYNAWDIVDRFEDHPIPMGDWSSVEVVENGPVSAALLSCRVFGSSRAEQVVRIFRRVPRIDFETWVDWREEEKLLKVAFPLRLRAVDFSTDTSAGAYRRDLHRNTSWEQARFEVCCHKWARVADGGLGFSILNNGKYGCDFKDSTLRLSLLRAPVRPDRTSDREEHRFTYSVFLDRGHWPDSGLIEAAYDLNWPLRARPGAWDAAGPALSVDGLTVQSLKLTEDGSGDAILRLVELRGRHGTARISAPGPLTPCDLLERPISAPLITDKAGTGTIEFRAHEILTLRLNRSLSSTQPEPDAP